MAVKHIRPVISVVVPAYNEEDYLPKSLQALKNQEFHKAFEVIVVDNNSTDNTHAIASSFNTRIIKEKNQGLIFAKQAGCKHARAGIIAVLDADNIPSPDWLERIDRHFSDEHLAAVTGPYRLPGVPWWGRAYTSAGIYNIRLVQALTRTSPHIWGGNVAFRRKHFEAFGGYDTRFTFAADEVKLRKNLKKFGRIQHDMRLSVTSSSRRFKDGAYYFFIEFLLKGYLLNYFSTSLFGKSLETPKDARKEA